MSTQILLVILLAFLINLITTLSYSVRIVGIRTGRIAVSFSLFNILVLISRTAYGFQAPLLANTVEKNIKMGVFTGMADFQWIIFASTIATIIGGFLIPSFQRLLSIAVLKFSETKSVPKILLKSLSKEGVYHFKESMVWPKSQNLKINFLNDFPWKVFLMNVFAVAILTIGVLSSIYAGYLNPDFRTTASSLSAIINGMATILMFVFIDPFLSSMTDDVVQGKCTEATFRRYIVYMVIARVVGTVLSQILLLPSAHFIVFVARLI
jgi:hypothetical protein